jgi:hypothetical protein
LSQLSHRFDATHSILDREIADEKV